MAPFVVRPKARRGRPGADTADRKIAKRRFGVQWSLDREAIAHVQQSDGMYPSCRARHDGYYAARRIMPRWRTVGPCILGALCSAASVESA